MQITQTTYSAISHLRNDFLDEVNIQFVLDKCYRYGWADAYGFYINQELVGYGSVWGKDKREDRDTVFEFYVVPQHRDLEEQFFINFCHTSNVPYIECQTNDKLLYPLFKKYTSNISTDAILFADHHSTHFQIPNVRLEKREQPNSDDNHYVLINNAEEVGEGGFMINYNFPYADIYYSIHEQHRRKGFGTFFVQELKAEVYKQNRIASARCNPSNIASKATMLKAGMIVCGKRLSGEINLDERANT